MPECIRLIRYKTADGRLFESEAAAVEHEQLIAAIKTALEPLGEQPDDTGCRFSNGHGYRKHDADAVRRARTALIEASRLKISDWMAGQEQAGADLASVHPSWFGRVADDSGCGPLADAWWRFCCLDSENREWGQPYYASHPTEGVQVPA